MPSIFGVRIDDVSSSELPSRLSAWLDEQKPHAIFTPNPEFLLLAREDPTFAELLNKSDLSLPDGVGLRFAVAAMTPQRLHHRQTGIDTLFLLADLCARKHRRLLLLGGINAAASDAAHVFKKKYPELDVVSLDPGFLPGGFTSLAIPSTLFDKIRELRPDVLAVALGQGRQERFIVDVMPQLPSLKIAIGVGGAFDTVSGRLKRAPLWMRHYGLEWLWRVLIEPKRIQRTLRAVVIFPSVVIWDTLKHRL